MEFFFGGDDDYSQYRCLSIRVLASLFTFPESASAQTSDWAVCASEGGTCAFTGTQEVRYGANGSYCYRTLTNGTACTNAVFGDPVNGVRKDCALRTATATGEWSVCAAEGGSCAFTGTQEVRYGANGSYYYKTLTGGTACTNAVFGDPAYGVRKDCSLRTASDWNFCASEGGTCALPAPNRSVTAQTVPISIDRCPTASPARTASSATRFTV